MDPPTMRHGSATDDLTFKKKLLLQQFVLQKTLLPLGSTG
jgi:hypothetical protein